MSTAKSESESRKKLPAVENDIEQLWQTVYSA